MTPNALLEMKQLVAAMPALMAGQFDEQIARLQAATKEWDARNSLSEREAALETQERMMGAKRADVAREQSALDEANARSVAAAQARMAEIKAAEAAVSKQNAASDSRVSDLDKRDRTVAARETALQIAQAAFDTSYAERMAQIQERERNVTAREQEVAKARSALAGINV